MEALEAILTRRSIRKYTDEPVSQQEEEIILKAAMNAQNGNDRRGWAFVVVRNADSINTLSDCVRPNGEPLHHTPMAIVVCGDMRLAIKNWRNSGFRIAQALQQIFCSPRTASDLELYGTAYIRKNTRSGRFRSI